MASTLPAVAAGLSPEFEERRARWAAERAVEGEAGGWALDRAVAASLRIELCEKAFYGIVSDGRKRAELAWEEDREVEAATIFGRLARDPVLSARQLRTSLAGAELLVEAWLGLASTLKDGRDWSEAEASRALDLLGVDPLVRSGRTAIDPIDASDPVAFRLELALDEVERLEVLAEESLLPLEEMDRRRALAGDAALLSRPAKLVLRYEGDAWRRYRESMKELEAQAPPPPAVIASPPARVLPPVAELPRVAAKPVPKPAPTPTPKPKPELTFEEKRRALLAEAKACLAAANAPKVTLPYDEEDAWLDELERRIGGLDALTERTQFSVGKA